MAAGKKQTREFKTLCHSCHLRPSSHIYLPIHRSFYACIAAPAVGILPSHGVGAMHTQMMSAGSLRCHHTGSAEAVDRRRETRLRWASRRFVTDRRGRREGRAAWLEWRNNNSTLPVNSLILQLTSHIAVGPASASSLKSVSAAHYAEINPPRHSQVARINCARSWASLTASSVLARRVIDR
jgi:hypothetical protein